MMQLPDLSKWLFNALFGLGDKEHNRKVREKREGKRNQRKSSNAIDTWNIWEYYTQEEKSNFVYMRNMKGGEQGET